MRSPLYVVSGFSRLALAIALLATPAWAQEPPALLLTLESAQARAIETSHRLAEARAREAAAQAVIARQEAASRPLVSVSAGYTRTNHVPEFAVPGPAGVARVIYPDVPDNYRTRLDLQWPIYSGGRTDALERAARAEAEAVAADVAAAQADLRLEVARAYWALTTARASVGVLEQGVGRAQAHVADVQQRFENGLIPPNEIASAQAQEARSRMLLIEARNQRDAAAADLARLIGAGPAQPLQLAPAAEERVRVGYESHLARARAQRAERQALERRIAAAEGQLGAAAAGRRPSVALVGGADYARPNTRIFPRAERWDDSWDVGVNVSWSLWDGGRTAADVAQAASAATAARRRLDEFESVLATEVRQRELDVDSALAAITAADEAVRAAAEARRVVAERYRAGVITQIEVLDAEYALLQAELDRTRAQSNLWLADARLARAVGR